jgi:hypothetical protein
MFAVRARLDLSVQAIRQILDIQGSHKFLQNAPSMEEGKVSVKALHQGRVSSVEWQVDRGREKT